MTRTIAHESACLAELLAALPDAVETDPELRDAVRSDRSNWEGGGPRPLAVVLPRTEEEVRAAVRIAGAHAVPVTARGTGTGLSGAANALPGGIVLDLSRMDRILELDPVGGVAVVEPGVLNSALDARAAVHGLMFAPDPASAAISTVGGNIATNAGGLRCVKYGATRDAVLGLRVVLGTGEVVDLGGRTRKNVTGLDLLGLLVGSEGTLGIIVRATVRLVPRPRQRRTMIAVCADAAAVQRAVVAVSTTGVTPSLFEFMDRAAVKDRGVALISGLGLADAWEGMLILQTDGNGAEGDARAIAGALESAGASVTGALEEADAERVMRMRRGESEAGTGDPQIVDDDAFWWLGEDMAVPPQHLADYLLECRRVAEARGVAISLVAHVGDGNLHPSITVPRTPENAEEARARLLAAADDLIRAAHGVGGALTGEHGVGLAKREWLPLFLDDAVRSLSAEVKAAFDPRGILNPGRGY